MEALVSARPELIALARGLHRCGWEIREADFDLVAGRATLRLHRFDGRWLHLSATGSGTAMIERWHRDDVVERTYNGSGVQTDTHRDQFLGRTRYQGGGRAALRGLCTYLADNPAPGFPSLVASEARNLFRPLM